MTSFASHEAPEVMMETARAREEAHKSKTFYKTKMCIYIEQGRVCFQGDKCDFAHNPEEIKPLPSLRNARMCPDVLLGRPCRYRSVGEFCLLAHDEEELPASFKLYKVSLCKFWRAGKCNAGSSCKFAHGESELAVPIKDTSSVNGGISEVLRSDSTHVGSYSPRQFSPSGSISLFSSYILDFPPPHSGQGYVQELTPASDKSANTPNCSGQPRFPSLALECPSGNAFDTEATAIVTDSSSQQNGVCARKDCSLHTPTASEDCGTDACADDEMWINALLYLLATETYN